MVREDGRFLPEDVTTDDQEEEFRRDNVRIANMAEKLLRESNSVVYTPLDPSNSERISVIKFLTQEEVEGDDPDLTEELVASLAGHLPVYIIELQKSLSDISDVYNIDGARVTQSLMDTSTGQGFRIFNTFVVTPQGDGAILVEEIPQDKGFDPQEAQNTIHVKRPFPQATLRPLGGHKAIPLNTSTQTMLIKRLNKPLANSDNYIRKA